MAKYYTKEQTILKFKYDILPTLKEVYGKDDHGNFELGWLCYLEELYEARHISLSQKNIWVYPKKLLGL